MPATRFVFLLVALGLIAAPARHAAARAEEIASFRVDGPPARVYLDGRYVGDTPLDLEVPCNEVTDRQYRIERDGCTPLAGVLNARLGAGRVVGGAASLGISLLFKCPNYFVPVSVKLDCAGLPASRSVVSEDVAPRRPLTSPVTPKATSLDRADIEQRLRVLDNLRDKRAISEAEYQSRRDSLLRQLQP